jgi:hypothetical protein
MTIFVILYLENGGGGMGFGLRPDPSNQDEAHPRTTDVVTMGGPQGEDSYHSLNILRLNLILLCANMIIILYK